MVFESLFIDTFNKLLGDYIENLDKSQLEVGIWSGRVTLYNLRLLTNALDELNIPVHLIHGHIGKIELKIPWKRIYSRPAVIVIEDVCLLLAPKELKKYNEEEELKNALDAKYEALQKIEDTMETKQDKPKPDKTFIEKLIAQIVNNLQIEITSVHIRYEDSTTISKPFSCGLGLQELALFTTDANWVKSYQNERSPPIFKVGNLNSLSLYYNCMDHLYAQLSEEELINALRNNIAIKQKLAPRYQYLIQPISTIAKVRLNMNPELDDPPFVIPIVYLSMEMDTLQLALSTTQYQDMLMITDAVNRIYVGIPYRKFRPYKTPYANNARIWWKFAITCVIEVIKQKNTNWSWLHIRDHRELCKLYARKLREREFVPWNSEAIEDACRQLEQELDIFNIVLIRNRVRVEMSKAKMTKPPKKVNWFRMLLMRFRRRKKTTEEFVEKLNAEMTAEEKEKLYAIIGYQENATPLNIPKEYKARTCYFELVALEIRLYDDSSKRVKKMLAVKEKHIWTLLLLKFTSFECSLEQRPSADAYCFKAAMKVMTLTGLEKDNSPPVTIIKSKVGAESNLFELLYETKPLNGTCDRRLKMNAHSLQILYDSATIQQLSQVFELPEDLVLPELDVAATQAKLKDRSNALMKHILEAHEVVEVDINCMPNIIILPKNGVYEPDASSAIVVCLGKLRATSKPHEIQPLEMSMMFGSTKAKENLMYSVVEGVYDKYKLTIDGIQILIAHANEQWEDVIQNDNLTDMHILRPTTLRAIVALCVFDDDPRLSRIKVNVILPHLHCNLTEKRIYETFQILASTVLHEGKERPRVSTTTTYAASLKKKIQIDMDLLKSDHIGSLISLTENQSIQEDMTQYTDYEISFALKDFIVTLYAPSSSDDNLSIFSGEDSEISLFSQDDEETLNPVSVNQVSSISVRAEPKRLKTKIVTMQILQFEADVTQRTYEFIVSTRIGSVKITQFDILDNFNRIVIVDTPRYSRNLKFKKYLLTVDVTLTDRKHPGFAIRKNRTEQLIVVNFSTLNVIGHKEYLSSLMTLLNTIYSNIQDLIQPAIAKLTKIIGEEAEEVAVLVTRPHLRHKKATTKQEIIEHHFRADLDEVSLELTCNKRPIAIVDVKRFFVELITKTSYTKVNLSLKNIIVIDPNPRSRHSSILSIVCNDALKFQMITYNSTKKTDPSADDMEVEWEIGCIKIVFLNWFFNSVMIFFNSFTTVEEETLSDPNIHSDTVVAKSIVLDDTMRIRFNLVVNAPLVIIPVNSQSLDVLVLNLGSLIIYNQITPKIVPDKKQSPAFIDEISLQWKDVKLNSCTLMVASSVSPNQTSEQLFEDPLRFSEENKCDKIILDLLSFTLTAKRNLSFSWYHNEPEMNVTGVLQLIQIDLLLEDYSRIISIFNENLTEGLTEFQDLKVLRRNAIGTFYNRFEKLYELEQQVESKVVSKLHQKVQKDKKDVYKKFLFSFQLDGVIINLSLDENDGLACFSLYSLSIKVKSYTDGVFKFTLFLCTLQVNDRRNDRTRKTTKYLCRKDMRGKQLSRTVSEMKVSSLCWNDPKHIFDFTVIRRDDELFVKFQLWGFDLILCIDFVQPLIDFFTSPFNKPSSHRNVEGTIDPIRNEPSQSSVKPGVGKAIFSEKLNVSFSIEQLNIILIESLEVVSSIAIIIELDSLLDYRAAMKTQQLTGQIDAIQMYMCTFLPTHREDTKHYIIHPCVIKLETSSKDDSHVHLSLRFSDLIINVSPATMELINKIMTTLQVRSKPRDSIKIEAVDYSDLWNSSKFDESEYWFISAIEDKYRLESTREHLNEDDDQSDDDDDDDGDISEICNVTIDYINIIIEDGVGFYTTPLLSIHSKITATVEDWSSELKIGGSLCLTLDYFNRELASWEPMIEKNQIFNSQSLKEFVPWELYFTLVKETIANDQGNMSFYEKQRTKIKIHSEKKLQLTLSKTGLELLYLFWEDFSQAIESEGLIKPDIISPCVIKNSTEMQINLDFTQGVFTPHEYHLPNTAPKSVVTTIKKGWKIIETLLKGTKAEEIKFCKILSNESLYLRTKDIQTSPEEDGKYKIYLTVGDNSSAKEIVVPIYKSDKRYFPIHNDPNSQAIITAVYTKFGTAKVRVHGIVIISNHLNVKVSIYQELPDRSEKVIVDDVAPGKIYNLPLSTIYTENNALYFAIGGYKLSHVGFAWNESLTESTYALDIQCDPIVSYEPFFIHVVREKTPVLFENTNKYRPISVFYTIHLHPPFSLRNALPINLRVSVSGCSVYTANKSHRLTRSLAENIFKKDEEEFGERRIRPGEVLQITSYKIGGGVQYQNLLVLRLLQYLDRDWTCTTNISMDRNVEIWTFSSYDSAERMDLDLYVHFDHSSGTLLLNIYSPYWMINKTGRMLSYKADNETMEELYHPVELQEAVLFSFIERRFFEKKSTAIRVENGDWSPEIPIDVAGSIGSVTCRANSIDYVIGVHNHLTHDAFTRKITFRPFFIANNKCEFLIEYQEYTRPADRWIKLQPNSCRGMWPKNSNDRKVILKVHGQYTVPFDYSKEQCTLLKLKNNKYGGINVYVHATEGGVSIEFNHYNPGDAPALLMNHSTQHVTFCERGCLFKHKLKPGEKMFYTWKDPTGEKLLTLGKNAMVCDLRKDGFGELIFQDGTGGLWISFLDGLQRTILFTHVKTMAHKAASEFSLESYSFSIEVRIRDIGFSVVNDEACLDIFYLGISNSDIIWESRNASKAYYRLMNPVMTKALENLYQQYLDNKSAGKDMSAHVLLDNKWPINFEDMTLKKNVIYHLQRNYYPGLWLSIKSAGSQTKIHYKIRYVQIDNQLNNCIFPEVLHPMPTRISMAPSRKIDPFIEYSSVQSFVPYSSVRQYKYINLSIQEFYLKVDFMLLYTLYDYLTVSVDNDMEYKLFQNDAHDVTKPLSELFESQYMMELKNFYDHIEFSPLKIYISFSMGGYDNEVRPGIISTIVHALGITLTDVNDAIFYLPKFEREYTFLTDWQLSSEAQAHYIGFALKQLYVLVLGLDVLGNPYGLVLGLKRGVEDLIYEPYQGAIQGPSEFVDGLALGLKSFVGHTVGGTAGAISKITGSVGKGLALLTLDHDFQQKRRFLIYRRPVSFRDDMRRCWKSLLMGICDGLMGFVKKPLFGAQKAGFNGFMNGFGRGTVGLITCPVAGFVDFASVSLLAVKHVTTTYKQIRRMRPSRFLHKGKTLMPYSYDYAQGIKLLKKIVRGKYSSDIFEYCEELEQKDNYIIATNQRVLFVQKSYLLEMWMLQWCYIWYDINSIVSSDDLGCVVFKLNSDSYTVQPKFITISMSNKERRDNLANILENLRLEA